MKNRLPISVCLISGAEVLRIGRALESVADWTSEIVVVLNEDVADGTDRVAARYGAKIFREAWKGHIAQKNSAMQKATQEWVLGLDTDEVVSPEFREEIEGLFATRSELERFAGFGFPRLTFFCGRWIRHGDWYPDRGTRLWRRGLAEWGGVNPHDKLLVRGAVGDLKGPLLHFNAAGVNEQIAKISSYSDSFVENALEHRHRVTWLDLVVRPCWRFLRGYLLRLGFLDGWQGYYIAWMTAFYTVTRYAKVREARTRENQQTPAKPA
jgi:glycosyltransferase involved in cell wall biosynthesis